MTYNYKLEEICRKFEGKLIGAGYDENGGIYIKCDNIIRLEDEGCLELINSFKSLIKRVVITAYPRKDVLSEIIEFKEMFPELDTKIELSNFFDKNCETYKDGKAAHIIPLYLEVEQFEKLCNLNEICDGRGLYRIYRSSNNSIGDVVTLGGIHLYSVDDMYDIDNFMTRVEDNDIDSNFGVLMPNREPNHRGKYDTYDIGTYKQIMQKLHEITGDIKPEMPDLKKFAIIYDRIGRFIDYDYSSFGISMTDENYRKSRNLKNGLLSGKCLCEGYAEILMNALKIVGINSDMITGKVLTKTENLEIEGFQVKKNQDGEPVSYVGKNKSGNNVTFYKVKDGFWRQVEECGGEYFSDQGHAWNIIFIDGQQFFADVTWDRNNIKSGNAFQFIQSREEMESYGKVLDRDLGEVKGLSDEKKQELLTYQYEMGHRRSFENVIKQLQEDTAPYLYSYVMKNILFNARGDLDIDFEMFKTLIQIVPAEDVMKACSALNNPQVESRMNELLEQMTIERKIQNRPTELPYSRDRIAEGVIDSKGISEQLMVACSSKVSDDIVH